MTTAPTRATGGSEPAPRRSVRQPYAEVMGWIRANPAAHRDQGRLCHAEGCHKHVYFAPYFHGRRYTGALVPWVVSPDDPATMVSHFETCPHAQAFSRGKRS